MILYFADRNLNILGQANTHLPKGVRVVDDLKTEDVETGCAIFECDIAYDKNTRAKVNEWTKTGNYILRSSDGDYEVYNIIDREKGSKKSQVSLYAEDEGLDLLNVVVGKFESSNYQPITYYLGVFASDIAGWEIGINELVGITRKLSFDTEETASARLLRIAEAFNAEISYSFEIDGLKITKKKINIYEKRGKYTGEPLRINKEIDSIITTETISNLATALRATGGTPENAEEPITLLGYSYDDGDFYVDGAVLKSRKAFDKWRRFIKGNQEGGHITKQFSFETLSQAELCEKAIEQLKTICDVEINYEIDITDYPENVRIGDRANIIDDSDELYLSSRVLILETSVTNNKRSAVFGEHLIKKDGISSKVEKLAAEFAKSTLSVARAKNIANNAKDLAEEAKTQAENALTESENAKNVATEAKNKADAVTATAENAAAKALAAETAVNKVEESVQGIQTTVENAQNAANNAYLAAATATQKAEEAKTAAENAESKIDEAATKAEEAKTAAELVTPIANEAKNTANSAKEKADNATAIARAAKIDAEQAEKDVEAFIDSLDTLSQTMQAEYARKTDLTETEADLKTKISQNAEKIETTASQVVKIDETANNAFGLAIAAQSQAIAAQTLADNATAYVTEAQQAATEAAQAATAAQNEANTAKAAAETARTVADNAKADLEAAKADLETVLLRADATEEEIAAAKVAVETAQIAADTAKAEVKAAETVAINARNVADKAVAKADEAQAEADAAVIAATIAQQAAEEAKGNAEAAQAEADAAKETAINAQNIATEAQATAIAAQQKAVNAVLEVERANELAETSAEISEQAKADLAAAEQTLSDVLANVDATEEEVEAARSAVDIAQAEADKAEAAANAAQIAANEAAEYAATAQETAEAAQVEAEAAQAAADEAMQAVEIALGEVGKLEVRTIVSNTKITQNTAAIELTATKDEVRQTLGGYYTKEETEAALTVRADEISSTVKSELTTDIESATDNSNDALVRLEAAETQIKQLSDNISMLVQKGDKSSQMVFDENSSTWSFDTGEIDENISKHTTDIEDLKAAANDTAAEAESVKIRLDNFEEHISIGTYEDEPCLTLFENDSNYKQRITNTRRIITETVDGEEVVKSKVGIDSAQYKKVVAEETSQIGGFAWKKTGTNRIGLVWEGAIE